MKNCLSIAITAATKLANDIDWNETCTPLTYLPGKLAICPHTTNKWTILSCIHYIIPVQNQTIVYKSYSRKQSFCILTINCNVTWNSWRYHITDPYLPITSNYNHKIYPVMDRLRKQNMYFVLHVGSHLKFQPNMSKSPKLRNGEHLAE
jgi:hypothetical protein